MQSDYEDEFIDDEVPEELNDIQNEDIITPPVSSEPGSLETSRRDRRIIVPDRRVLRGKNQHCWSLRFLSRTPFFTSRTN